VPKRNGHALLAQLELVASASGRLKIIAPAETVVRKGTVIGRIEPV
jgi:hypothetical protein